MFVEKCVDLVFYAEFQYTYLYYFTTKIFIFHNFFVFFFSNQFIFHFNNNMYINIHLFMHVLGIAITFFSLLSCKFILLSLYYIISYILKL